MLDFHRVLKTLGNKLCSDRHAIYLCSKCLMCNISMRIKTYDITEAARIEWACTITIHIGDALQ